MNWNWQALFLSFDGRIGRRDFWLGAGVLIGANLLANLIPIVGALVSVAVVVPWTGLLVKRLHDFGRSGRLALIAVVPAVGAAVLSLFMTIAVSNVATMSLAFAGAGMALAVSTLTLVISLGFLIWVGTRPGDPQPNVYGPRASYAIGTT